VDGIASRFVRRFCVDRNGVAIRLPLRCRPQLLRTIYSGMYFGMYPGMYFVKYCGRIRCIHYLQWKI
jgi:hypothetical protein